jgi:hypothetical protein
MGENLMTYLAAKRYPQPQGFPLTLAANLCDNSKLQQEQEITILYLIRRHCHGHKNKFHP